jgi:hypothetical protein
LLDGLMALMCRMFVPSRLVHESSPFGFAKSIGETKQKRTIWFHAPPSIERATKNPP